MTDKDKKPKGSKPAELPPLEDKKLMGHEEVKQIEGHEEPPKLEGHKVAELEDQLLRLRADFENYKKRKDKESSMLMESSAADMLRKLISIVDEFEMAMAHVGDVKDKEFRRGIELIYAKLLDMLAKEGVVEMKALGESFDPYRHDALRHERGEEGKVIEVIQKGYLFKSKVLRHAKVVVGKEVE